MSQKCSFPEISELCRSHFKNFAWIKVINGFRLKRDIDGDFTVTQFRTDC